MGQWQNKFKSISTLNNNREYETGDFDTKETYNIPINNTQYLFNLLKNHPYVYRILKGDRLQFDFYEPVENSTDGQMVVQKTVLIDINDLNGVSKNKIGFVTLTSSSGSLTSEQVVDVMKPLCIIDYNGNYYFNVTDITENNIFNRTFVSQVRTVDVNNGEYVKLVQDSIVVTCDTAYTGTYSYIENTKVETYTKSQLDAKIPTTLSQLTGDSTHRTVTDSEKTTWNNKQDEIPDLAEIRAGASLNEASIYHLGVYDSVDGNRITRQTGYVIVNADGVYLENASVNLFRVDGKMPNAYSHTSAEKISVANVNTYTSNEFYGSTSKYGMAVDNNNTIFIRISGITTLAQMQSYLASNPIQIQYKLATSYTEDIIPNQPLNTLDQTGSQWLREEWEKGLNLGSFPDRTGRWWVTVQQDLTNFINQLPNGTYTISADLTPLSIDSGYNIGDCFFWLQITGGQYTGDGVHDQIMGFTSLNQTLRGNLRFTKENYTNYSFRLWGFGNHNGGNHGQGKCSNIMLNEGDHAYPYQEYNGAILHQKDLTPTLLWENANPQSDLGSTSLLISNLYDFKYLIIEYNERVNDDSYLFTSSIAKFKIESNHEVRITGCDGELGEFYSRMIFFSNDSSRNLTIGDGKQGQASDNNALVPVRIYGTNLL